MADNYSNDPLFSKQVIDMFTVANEYCLFFDKAEEYDCEDIFEYFHKVAPLLYLKGGLIPSINVNDPSYNERFLTEEQYQALFMILKEKFNKKDLFYILDVNYEAKNASLAECMADIYQDMKDFVWLYRKENSFAKENSIAQIKLLYENRWGIKVINALKAIHHTKFNIEDDNEFFDDDLFY